MMSIGCDIESISRFENKDQAFLDNIFTKKEQEYCLKKKQAAKHFAARWCAKESIIKALSHFNKKVTYTKIEILNKEDGSPSAYIEGLDLRIKVSLSHSKDNAMAVAIITDDAE